MNIISNEGLIRRNARIAQVTNLAGLLVIAGAAYLLFTNPENITYAWMATLLGFVLSQVGIYFTNRYGRRPRPDELINQSLKGLDGRYSIYHYKSPTSHLLIGPAGVWVLLPHYQRGRIVYENGRWKQKGVGLLHTYLRVFGQEGLGRPDLEIKSEVEGVRNYLSKNLDDGEVPPIQAVLVFTNERAQVEAEDAPTPTISLKKLKDTIRKAAKGKTLPPEKQKDIQQAIEA